jgi:hypothetical protein
VDAKMNDEGRCGDAASVAAADDRDQRSGAVHDYTFLIRP